MNHIKCKNTGKCLPCHTLSSEDHTQRLSITFLTNRTQLPPTQSRGGSSMSLVLAGPPDQRPVHQPLTSRSWVSHQHPNISPSPPASLSHSPLSKPPSSTPRRICPKIPPFPEGRRAAPHLSQFLPGLPTRAEPQPRTCSLRSRASRDSSSCQLLPGARSYLCVWVPMQLKVPVCSSQGPSSAPSPAATPGRSPVTAEQGCSHAEPQSKEHHFLPFLLLRVRYATEPSTVKIKPHSPPVL